ncbi:MAG: LysM peptidoglycan-binding domain-containing protein [Acidobacteriaceae bacterium]
MSLKEAESYLSFPAFCEAMEHFRIGRWDAGFSKLLEVEKNFPMEPEIRAIRQEMEVRSRITQYEVEENKDRNLRHISKISLRIFASVVIVAVILLAISTYSGWIQRQITQAQSDLSQNMLQAQLALEFRNGQQLITAGKSDEALSVYENIKAKNPEFPGLAEAINQVQALKDVETQYSQAMNLLQLGDAAQALSLLQSISQKMPNYRDVSLQIRNLQSVTQMSTVIQQSDLAFSEGRYEDAVAGYESIRLMDPTYETSHVEDYLFQSYIKAAQALLAEPVPTLETLRKIDGFFSSALSLRPLDREALAARTQVRQVIEARVIGDYLSQAQAILASEPDSLEAQKKAEDFLIMALAVSPADQSVLVQFKLAQAYIRAIDDFASSKWDAAVEQLEFVISEQASYANGTAIQTLFDTYIARGTDYIAAGEYPQALEDFQRAAVLAQGLPDSEPLAFEAQTMIGEAQGLLNHFQEAVLIYQDALNTIGLRSRIAGLQNSLSDTLAYAESTAKSGDYQSSFYAYRSLVRKRVGAYDQTTKITVKSGDYLSMLARRYNTTVAAILSANNMNNQPRLSPNTELIIPIIP